MDSPVGGSASSLYTQQSQPIGIASAENAEPESPNTLEPLLPTPDSYHSEEGPDNKTAADRTIYSHSESKVIPRLASGEDMRVYDSPAHIATLTMTRVGNLPENKPEETSKKEPAGSSVSSPAELEEITSITSENVEKTAALPKDSEADGKKDRSHTSAFLDLFRNCCPIRDRSASHHPPKSEA